MIKESKALQRLGHCRIGQNIFGESKKILEIVNTKLYESYHLYEPDINSEYQKHIKNIVIKLLSFINTINYNNINPIIIHKNMCKFFQYNIDNPFSNTKLSKYKKLKIFLNIDSDIKDAIALNIPEYNQAYEQDICTEEIISIIIFVDNKTLNNKKELTKYLYDCIIHEMRHILELNYSANFQNKAGNINELCAYYKEKFNLDKVSIFDKKEILNFGIFPSINTLYWFLTTCCYLISDHEMGAHIENIIHEIKYSNYKNINKEFDSFDSKLCFLSNTYNDYDLLSLMINKLLEINIDIKYQPALKVFSEKYFNALKKKRASPKFIYVLKYWKNKLIKYKKRIQNAVIQYFMNNYQFDFNNI